MFRPIIVSAFALAALAVAPNLAAAEPAACADTLARADDALVALTEDAVLEVLESQGATSTDGFGDASIRSGIGDDAKVIKKMRTFQGEWDGMRVMVSLVEMPDDSAYFAEEGECRFAAGQARFGKGARGIELAVLDAEWAADEAKSSALLDAILEATAPTTAEE